MCQNLSKIFIKFGIATLVSAILGVITGIAYPAFPERPVVFLLLALVTSSVIMLVIAIYLLNKQGKVCQCMSSIKYYIALLLTGSVGSFITSIIGLSTLLASPVGTAVILGFAVAFFTLTISAVVLIFGYLISTLESN